MTLIAPAPLANHHDLTSFESGTASLDDWLKRRARANQATGASRTYVVSEGDRVIGYYALASGAVKLPEAAGKFRRNMPDPIPVIVLGRLAIDHAWQGQGLGRVLVRDAGRRVLQAAEVIGARGMLVHAISEDAHRFYIALGLYPSPVDTMTLMVTLEDLRQALAE